MRFSMLRSAQWLVFGAMTSWSGLSLGQTVPSWSPVKDSDTYQLEMGASNSQVLLQLRLDSGPVRSTDGGNSWVGFSVQGSTPNSIHPAPLDSQTFYAITGPSSYGSIPSPLPSLYRSRDAGATWQIVKEHFGTANGELIGNIVVGSDPDVLVGTRMSPELCSLICGYAGVEVVRSFDGGVTWQSTGPGVTGVEVIAYPAPSEPSTIYASSTDGIFHTRDGGASWRRVRDRDAQFLPSEIAVDRRDASIVYVRNSDHQEISVSEDAGTTWRAAAPFDAHRVGYSRSRHLLTDPIDKGRVYYVGDGGHVYESRDAGRSWMRVVAGNIDFTTVEARMGVDGPARNFWVLNHPFIYRTRVTPDAMVLGSDLWWNPAQPGIGFTITQHADGQTFAVWYAYDADGNPVWRTIPGGSWTDSRTFTGTLYQTRGPNYFNEVFDAARVSVAAVGSATLHFADDSHAQFSYRLTEGAAGTVPIERELFARPSGFEFADYSDLWWNAAESGWGVALSQQHGKFFAAWYVYDDAGKPLWIVLPDSTASYDRDGSLRIRGDIYATTGPPFGTAFDPSLVKTNRVGSATFLLSGRSAGSLEWTAFGKVGTRALAREPF
jgi:YD repeat-containing protein